MKKLILPLFCFFLLAWVSSTNAWMGAVGVGGGQEAAAGACTTANDEEPIDDGTTSWSTSTTNSGTSLSDGTNGRESFSFTIDGSGTATITEVGINSGYWICSGNCTLNFEIQGDNSGKPDNSAISNGTGSIVISNEATNTPCVGCQVNKLEFSTYPTVTKSTQYHVVMWADASDQIYIGYDNGGAHASVSWYTTDGGTNWTTNGASYDYHFTVNGCD